MRKTLNRFRAFILMLGLMVAAYSMFPAASAWAVDAVQARKDLKQMGLDYTEQQFATSAGEGDKTAVQLFLDAGMDVNAGGGAALGVAAGRGKTEMVKYLLSKGAKPTSNALQFAKTRGHKDIEKILIDAGAKE
ncbi:MAG: ankyrin repeat domain-containing protein [Deltaproteobacteria bacterium]|nr:ankyrin repeat domain-containing protein [Deltaproteobacteria bacterium]